MKTASIALGLTSVAALAAASPAPKEKRATTFCDQWGLLEVAGYST